MASPMDNQDQDMDMGGDDIIMMPDATDDTADMMAPSADKPSAAKAVYIAMADAFTMYFQTHGSHWNVRGEDFAQFHEFFGDIYEDVFDSVDTLAEIVRKFGFDSPMNLSDIADATNVPDTDGGAFDPISLSKNLYAINKITIADLEAAFDACNAIDQQGACNFLAERIDMHQKWQWQLRSTLGLDGNADDEK